MKPRNNTELFLRKQQKIPTKNYSMTQTKTMSQKNKKTS